MSDFDFNQIGNLLWDYLLIAIYGIIALIIGFWIVGRIVRVIEKQLDKRDIDTSLKKFLANLVSIGLKVLVLISVAGIVGIPTTSFIAVIGAAGLAVGLALQGSLANFAGGVLILFLKPFKVGDFIEAQGHSGTVETINIFNTTLKTPQNVTVVIPNAPLSNGSVENYSTEQTRRLDMEFGIGYEDDIDKAKALLEKIADADDRVLSEPGKLIRVKTLADSSVNFTFRVWCKGSDYWNMYFDFTEKVKKEFDANNISIPFPQRDLHVFNEK